MIVEDLPGTTEVASDPVALAARVAGWLVRRARQTERFSIALAGGSTPRFLYEALATSAFAGDIDWTRWEVFFGDERAVPPDHPESNFRLARDTLLAKVPVPTGQVHRIEAEDPDLDEAAARYSALLAREQGEPPTLDVVLLGLGPDGHTASLFPGTPALGVTDAWATRGRGPTQPVDRISLTLPAINAARDVVFLVTGPDKAAALRRVIAGEMPAAMVQPTRGTVRWFLDRAAAQSIAGGTQP